MTKPFNRQLIILLCAGLLLLPLAGCDREEGPMEELGESVDEAVDETQDSLEELGDESEGPIEELGDAVEDAGDEIEDATDGGSQ